MSTLNFCVSSLIITLRVHKPPVAPFLDGSNRPSFKHFVSCFNPFLIKAFSTTSVNASWGFWHQQLPPSPLFTCSQSTTRWLLWPHLMPASGVRSFKTTLFELQAVHSPLFLLIWLDFVCCVAQTSGGLIMNVPKVKDFLCPSMDEKKYKIFLLLKWTLDFPRRLLI